MAPPILYAPYSRSSRLALTPYSLYNGSLILYRIASILKTNVTAMQAVTAAASFPVVEKIAR